MHHVIFDIDGTLVQSYEFDEEIYACAVEEVLGFKIDRNWSKYKDVTDAGILNEIIKNHNLAARKEQIEQRVKRIFVERISAYTEKNTVKEIPGAISFLNRLANLNNVTVSFATGGWYETAVLKLNSAGFHYSSNSISSSDDHFKRTEIMAIAMAKCDGNRDMACTYFGDATWDKVACEILDLNFVLVGNKVNHNQTICDFNSVTKAMAFIGI